MRKQLFTILLAACGLSGITATAQTAATIPDNLDLTTPGMHPLNAASANFLEVNTAGVNHNLYVHSWSGPANTTISWRRTNSATGAVITDNGLTIDYALDLDLALQHFYDDYVLAAYYYDGPTNKGFYYNIYRFTTTGLTAVSTMNLLSLSNTPGRINVDARKAGMVITWYDPTKGVYLKAGNSPLAAFGPNFLLLPLSSGYTDPDVCLNQTGAATNINVVVRSTDARRLYVQSVDYSDVVTGTAPAPVSEYYTSSIFVTYGVPRIDCPYSDPNYKWAMVYGTGSASGGTVSESIHAVIQNSSYASSPSSVTVQISSYSGSTFAEQYPVVCYDNTATNIYAGWMTQGPTAVIPGTGLTKYVCKNVNTPTGTAPVSVAGTYRMISNTDGGEVHSVLAFSNQDEQSPTMHAVYSQRNPATFPITYRLYYKDKPWTSSTFKMAQEETGTDVTTFPNPFRDELSLTLPAKGNYEVSVFGADGRKVYNNSRVFEAMERTGINTASFAPGIYFLQVSSTENGIHITKQLQK